jgi:uncharacterized membrane protein YhaH (DUF805 family)
MGDIDFANLFTSAEGRINRQKWWIGIGLLFAVSLVSSLLFGSDGIVSIVVSILTFLAGFMLHIKRCHDRGKSGWWCLLLLIPFVGLIWAIVDLGILAGTEGENEYGPDPLAA